MREQFNAMKAKWDNEKAAIGKVQKLREEIEALNAEIEQAERKLRPEQSGRAEIRPAARPAEGAGGGGTAGGDRLPFNDSLLRDKVTDEEIARIVERWTGIPVSKLMEGRAG